MTGRPGSPPRLTERPRLRWALGIAGLCLFAGAAAIFLVPFAFPTPPPIITGFRGTQLLSPAAGNGQATFSVRVRERSLVSLEIRSSEGRVRTLSNSAPYAAGWQRRTWDGRDEAGNIVPDGDYNVRLRARSQIRGARVFNTSRRIRIDATPPSISSFSTRSATFAAPGPAQCRARAQVGDAERARFEVRRGGRLVAMSQTRTPNGEGRVAWNWNGENAKGDPVIPGIVEIRVTAIDRAGNRSRRAATCWAGNLTGRVVPVRPTAGDRVRVRLKAADGTLLPGDAEVALSLFEKAAVPGDGPGGPLGERVAGRVEGPLSEASVRLPDRPPRQLWLVARTESGLALIDPAGGG